MIKKIVLLAVFVFILGGCKSSSQKNTSTTPTVTTEVAAGKFKGKISHEYKKGGCTSVIIIEKENADPLILIPKDPLPAEFDKDEQQINFNYKTLRIKNPAGCLKGIPALITDISKAK